MLARKLRAEHPTSLAFLDESGSIAHDRYFSVGCLKLPETGPLTKGIQKLRDRRQWYKEFHWVDLTQGTLDVYKAAIDAVAGIQEACFSCFIADRHDADPVQRFGDPWTAYEKMAEQLLMGSIKKEELVSVLADNYSTPDTVDFEGELKSNVNRRFDRLAVTTVCRLDSQSADPLQIVDLLTGAVAFEFKQSVGHGGQNTPKAILAKYVRGAFGVSSCLGGFRNQRFNVAIHRNPG